MALDKYPALFTNFITTVLTDFRDMFVVVLLLFIMLKNDMLLQIVYLDSEKNFTIAR